MCHEAGDEERKKSTDEDGIVTVIVMAQKQVSMNERWGLL
jgi:hypothetical protein